MSQHPTDGLPMESPTGTARFVRLHEIEAFLALGWSIVDLSDTPHGAHAALAVRADTAEEPSA